uniref:Uncharacterized protein n=1 Tax=viral metagenome TaxID=1070528 RepID=A0A6M3K7C3_9ZZZZ
MRLLAVALILTLAAAAWAEVIFCNRMPGTYTGTCDGEQTTVTVEADGTLSAECQSVSLVRMTGGLSFSCEAVDE